MASRLSPPRVLPLTIGVMLLLLSLKAVTFARDAGAELGLTSGPPSPSSVTPMSASEALPQVIIVKQSPPHEVAGSEKALLLDLKKRREQLDARTKTLEERSSVVEAAEASLQAKIDHLASLQDQISRLDSARKKREDTNWDGLVKVYETMKPHDAAAIFDVLDMHVLLQVVDRMNTRKAAAILAAMQPERARIATQMLAQMRLQREAPMPQVASDSDQNTSTQP